MSRERTTLVITEEIPGGDISDYFLYHHPLTGTLHNLLKI